MVQDLTQHPIHGVKEIRVTARLRNNRLLTLREAAGLSQLALAQATGITARHVAIIERFGVDLAANAPSRNQNRRVSRTVPYETLLPSINKLAQFFDVAPEDLAPRELFEVVVVTETVREFGREEYLPLARQELLSLPAPDSDESLARGADEKILYRALRQRLAQIQPRYEAIALMRYFEGAEGTGGLKHITERFGISSERIRQLIRKSYYGVLVKSQEKTLSAFIDLDDDEGKNGERTTSYDPTRPGEYPWEVAREGTYSFLNDALIFAIDHQQTCRKGNYCKRCAGWHHWMTTGDDYPRSYVEVPVLSFENVCALLNLNPDHMRVAAAMKKTKKSRKKSE